MPDARRLGLLMGSSLPLDESMKQISTSVRDTNLELLSDSLRNLGDYAFTWPSKKSGGPEILRNPPRSRIPQALEKLDPAPTTDDLLLFYYFGHGFVGGGGNLILGFRNVDVSGQASRYTLNSILQEAVEFGFRKVILIIDCCHAGLAAPDLIIDSHGASYFLMASASSGWSYYDQSGGEFTQALAQALTYKNVKGLVDPPRQAATFHTWFNLARDLMTSEQAPVARGTLADELLFPYEGLLPPSVNLKAPLKSIYMKIYGLLRNVSASRQTLEQIYRSIQARNLPAFKIIRFEDGRRIEAFVSQSKIREYLVVARNLGMVTESDRKWSISSTGAAATAANGARLNEFLVEGIFSWLPKDLDRRIINDLLFELSRRAILPNVQNFEHILLERGLPPVPRKKLRIVLRLLSYAGVIHRATADTFFPSLGGL